MLRYAGLKRHAKGLEKGYEELARQLSIFETHLTKREEYEFANLLNCALLTTEAALTREESRGGHYGRISQNGMIWYGRKHIVFQSRGR